MIRYASYPSLEARVAFVTGGGSGIGASIVEHLCAQRARVAFVDIDRAASPALVETIAARGHPAPLFISCDLRDVAALRAAVAEARGQLGPIRVLVNNAANDEHHALEAELALEAPARRHRARRALLRRRRQRRLHQPELRRRRRLGVSAQPGRS